jgi:hypothetical protein
MQEIQNRLKQEGWRLQPNPPYINYSADMFWKQFPNHQRCYLNEGIGKQIEIYFSAHSGRVEIECAGEAADGTWIKLLVYAIDNPTYELLMEKVNSLLNLWDIYTTNIAAKNEVVSQ